MKKWNGQKFLPSSAQKQSRPVSPTIIEESSCFWWNWTFLVHQVHSDRRKGVWIQQQLSSYYAYQVGQSSFPPWASGPDHPHQLHSDPCRFGGTAARAGSVPWKARPGGSKGESKFFWTIGISFYSVMNLNCSICINTLKVKDLLNFLICLFFWFHVSKIILCPYGKFCQNSLFFQFFYNPPVTMSDQTH